MKKKKNQIKLEDISWFSARGLKRLFVVDHMRFGGKRKYTMDIWSTKDGRMLMRFHNKCEDAENEAYEIKGMQPSDIPKNVLPPTWIPDVINKEFDNWMTSEMPFFISMKDAYNFSLKGN